MQSFEFLGGKYQQGEQILPGLIQTYRSYEVPTGRPVFIHRIPSNDPAAQEIAALLSAGLIRSPAVRRMLLDVYETEPYRFVVTEPSRQCVPLREWLEREADETPEVAPKAVAAADSALPFLPPVKEAPELAPPSDDEVDALTPPDVDTSEFARLFEEALSGKRERSRRMGAQPQSVVAAPPTANEKAALAPEPEQTKPVAVQPKPAARQPTATPAKKPELPVEPVPAAAPLPVPEPEMFSQAVEVEESGRSTLIIFLVVLGVFIALVVMFVVVFVKR